MKKKKKKTLDKQVTQGNFFNLIFINTCIMWSDLGKQSGVDKITGLIKYEKKVQPF